MSQPLPRFCDQCGGPVFWDLVTNQADHSCEHWREAGKDEHEEQEAKLEAAERERDALRDVALVAAEAVARWKGGDGSFNEIMSDLGVALEKVTR